MSVVDAGLLRGEGTTYICANYTCANLRPRPFLAFLDEISMATNHARAENVTLSQQIGEVAAIVLGRTCGTTPGS